MFKVCKSEQEMDRFAEENNINPENPFASFDDSAIISIKGTVSATSDSVFILKVKNPRYNTEHRVKVGVLGTGRETFEESCKPLKKRFGYTYATHIIICGLKTSEFHRICSPVFDLYTEIGDDQVKVIYVKDPTPLDSKERALPLHVLFANLPNAGSCRGKLNQYGGGMRTEYSDDVETLQNEILTLRAEIERLKKEANERPAYQVLLNENQALKAEIERLRNEADERVVVQRLENSSPDVDLCSPPFPTASKFRDAVGGTPRNDLSHSHSVFNIISQSARRIPVNHRAIRAPELSGPRNLRYCSELIFSVPSIGQRSFRSLTTSGFNPTRAALQSHNSDISVPVESRYALRSKSRPNDSSSKGNISDLAMSSTSTSASNDVQRSLVQSILNNLSEAYYNNSGDLCASSVQSHSNARSVQPDNVTSVLEDTAPQCDDQPSSNLNYQEMVLDFCTPTDIVDFDGVFNKYKQSSWSKLGEGAYGEVFRGRAQRGVGDSVYKIMPIAGDCNVNHEPQKRFDEIIPELVITSELSNLRMAIAHSCPNFVKLKSMICARGLYPPSLLNAWDMFAAKKRSENHRPDFLSNDQLYIIFELGDGGIDLENFKFSSIDQAISIFRQVTMALAVAERQLKFEHRDLHIGNVLVKRTKKKYLTYKLAGRDAQVLTCGLQAHIIDYTLSRCERSTEQGITQLVFSNLEADKALFEGSGDYQFDVYRLMRELVENDWSGFHPKTNIFWLHYLCDKIINHFKYSDRMLCDNEFRPVVYEKIMSFESALIFVTESDFFADVYL